MGYDRAMEAWVPRRWKALLESLGLEGDGEGVLERLDAGYGAPGRAYHGWTHVRRCLGELDAAEHGELPSDRARAVLGAALWFHDAVYDPGRLDNEERSAALAREALLSLGLGRREAERVAELVLATAHGAGSPEPGDAAALVRDIDLAILAAPPPEFEAYDRAVRTEYGHLSDAEYRAGRSAVLRSFLGRPRIYLTPRFQAREARARANLSRAIALLDAGARGENEKRIDTGG